MSEQATNRPQLPVLAQPTRDTKAPPTSARRPILAGIIILGISFGGFGTWAALAPLDSAVVATAVVSVESRRKSVAHLEGGIVQEIFVTENQLVEAGDPLVRLDATETRASQQLYRTALDVAMAVEARLVAERDNAPEISFPEELLTREPNEAQLQQLMNGQRSQFKERRGALESQLSIQEQQMGQLRSEIQGYEGQILAREDQLKLLTEEVSALRKLYEEGYYPLSRIRAMEREMARLRGELASLQSSIARAQQQINEAQLKIQNIQQTFREEVMSELRTVQDRISENRERLAVAQDRLVRVDVRAPQRGYIQELKIHTKGGIVRPGEEMMQIVPLDDNLIVEAQISPADIDNVQIGQIAEVRFSALKLRNTPIILGEVRNFSADRIVNQQQNTAYYLAQVVVPPDQMSLLEGKEVKAGMPAEVIIKTGERTFLDYMVKPLTDALARSMTEQ